MFISSILFKIFNTQKQCDLVNGNQKVYVFRNYFQVVIYIMLINMPYTISNTSVYSNQLFPNSSDLSSRPNEQQVCFSCKSIHKKNLAGILSTFFKVLENLGLNVLKILLKNLWEVLKRVKTCNDTKVLIDMYRWWLIQILNLFCK